MDRVKRPCAECPFRADAKPGRFAPERWDVLTQAGANERGYGPEYDAPLFACHRTPEGGERACAGWLATEGANHPRVRLAVLCDQIPAAALTPGADWPDLHPTVRTAAAHDLHGGTP